MTDTLILPAPAKLNLFLHITGRRADGYHELQTIFQFLDQGDELHFQARSDGAIRLKPPLPGVPDADNLIVRAAHALQAASGCKHGADITLDKRLPMGGGIGGGSSDAATTLLALNRLWALDLDTDRLAAIGLQLGADVPVFVRGQAAWAEGVGERLSPLATLPEPYYLVLIPDCHVATVDVFRHPQLTRNSAAITLPAFLARGGRNDCEAVVRQLHPEVGLALDWLRRHGNGQLTGTGACVFLPCTDQEMAKRLLQQAPFAGFVARGRNVSPTLEALTASTSTAT